MHPIRALILATVVFGAAVAFCFSGCGGDDLVVGGMLPLTPTSTGPTATPECGVSGTNCTVSTDCCSAVCSGVTGTCQ